MYLVGICWLTCLGCHAVEHSRAKRPAFGLWTNLDRHINRMFASA